jgi:hypothetical protein
MKRCPRCKREFPSEFFDFPMIINGKYHWVCPICALALRNEVHGLNDTKFQGSIANEMLEKARQWVREHKKELTKCGF